MPVVAKSAVKPVGVRADYADQIEQITASLRDLEGLKRLAEATSEQLEAAKREHVEMVLRLTKRYPKLGDRIKRLKFKSTSGDLVIGTLVQPEPGVKIDEAKLRATLGNTRWNRVTTRVLDKTALLKAIDQGIVTTAEVSQCSNETEPGRPYIRFIADKGTEQSPQPSAAAARALARLKSRRSAGK